MAVDEKLAAGLTDRFFREATETFKAALADLPDPQPATYAKLSKWEHDVAKMTTSLAPVLVRYYTCRKKRHSHWLAAILVPDELSVVAEWKERCVKVHALRWDCVQNYPRFYAKGSIEVSAHAIKRAVQRSPIGFSYDDRADGFREHEILSLIREIPNWAGLYLLLLLNIPDGKMMFPVIPTEGGMFLCERRSRIRTSSLFVRTFIGKAQFTATQCRIHQALSESFAWLGVAPFFLMLVYLSQEKLSIHDDVGIEGLNRLRMIWLDKVRQLLGEDLEEWIGVLATPPQEPLHAPSAEFIRTAFGKLVPKYGNRRMAFLNAPSNPDQPFPRASRR